MGTELLTSRPVRVVYKAIQDSRLGHALLFYGEDLAVLDALVKRIAQTLLETQVDILQHPDVFTLGPSGKSRQIRVGKDANEPNTIRALIHDVQMSPVQAPRKVAIIREVDRMNKASANALLKTLEEPPLNTNILLITTRPYDLLATIRSRCMNFRIPTGRSTFDDAEWLRWLRDYEKWIQQLATDPSFGKTSPAHAVLPVFGLTIRFSGILDRLDEASWAIEKESLPQTIDEEQMEAMKAGHHKILRQKMLAHIEKATCDSTKELLLAKTPGVSHAISEAIQTLELCAGLLELNFKADAALEHFLLTSLRLWSRAASSATAS